MAEKKEASQKKVSEEKKPVPSQAPQAPQATKLTRADAGKRIAAAFIDGVPAYVISFIPFIGGLLAAAYLALRDALPLGSQGGQSLGKRLFQLQAVRMPDGVPCDYATSLLRNLPFVVPALLMIRPGIGWIFGSVVWAAVFVVEALLVIADENGARIGDRLAKTAVIDLNP
jgi:uncharacterized RDD family membrane protein YckC